MNKKLILVIASMVFLLVCAINLHAQQFIPQPPKSNVFEPPTSGVDTSVLPDMRDLPVPGIPQKAEKELPYIGIIKNKTRYDVSVPSRNSAATLIIPARSFIEYISYEKDFDVTVYRNGKPFYCLKITAHPREYAYMCRNDYDFIAEIVKPEPVGRQQGYKKMKRAIKKSKSLREKDVTG